MSSVLSQQEKGLSQAEAVALLQRYGKNVLPQKGHEPWWKKLLREFLDVMVIILIFASLLAFFLGEKLDGSIILGIVLLNGCIGFFQEWKSEKTLEALQKMVSPEANVIRDGQEQPILAELLVPGDVVVLREGDRIPADGKLLESEDLRVEESALTGESQPVHKAKNQEVFLGTAVTHGSAILQIVTTGATTKFGNIAHLTITTKSAKSPLQKELFSLGVFVGKLTFVLVILIFVLDFFVQKGAFGQSLLFAVSVAVAAVPEGLPATITIALALGVQRLAQKKAVIKQLASTETLGATTVICSDKTGTITRNEMTVRIGFLSSGEVITFTGNGWQTEGKILLVSDQALTEKNIENLTHLLTIAYNCNDAQITPSQEEQREYTILGDPTEAALLIAAQKFRENFEKKSIPTPEIIKKFPFDSERKMMSTFHASQSKGLLLTKGAPEMLLEQCEFYWTGEKIELLSAEKKQYFLQEVHKMSSEALRILAFASREFSNTTCPENASEAENHLTFWGTLGMIDPPRKEVPDAVQKAHQAQVRTIMITGDNPQTAAAIARQVGLITTEDPYIVTGKDLEQISDQELEQKLFTPVTENIYQEVLFARVAPEHKMRIVALLQKRGEIVAVTGDGVNDAPALKKADIGIAMGIAGTEVSKEAARMVLMNDSFATIVAAIREGRTIYENLKKCIWFLFAGNIAELFVILITLILAVPAPLTAVLILLINLGTDALPAITLSFEKEEKSVMNKPPRNSQERILKKEFILHFVAVGCFLGAVVLGAFFWMLFKHGWSFGQEAPEILHRQAMSMAFAALVFGQMFVALSARHFTESVFSDFWHNKFLLSSIALSTLLVFLIIFAPWCNALFQTMPVSSAEIAVVLLLSSLVLFLEEGRKFFLRRKILMHSDVSVIPNCAEQ